MSQIHEPATVEEAARLLASLGGDCTALAGATWVMREPRRRAHYVLLRGLGALRAIEREDGAVRVGALATHTEIGAIERGTGPLGALSQAARRSAFPAVRNVATLGGNVAAPFPEADLLPPLLAADATLELAIATGRTRTHLDAWVRGERPPGALIVAAAIPAPSGRRSWFERLTVRGGAEYSLVSVAVSVDLEQDSTVRAARVAVGAVETTATRVRAAEDVLRGRALERTAGEAAGRAAAEQLTARDGLDAPGWYRREVLPALIGRAVARLGGDR